MLILKKIWFILNAITIDKKIIILINIYKKS